MKSIFESVISRGEFDLPGLLKKIDSYHIDGKLSDADRDELYIKARERANAAAGVDVMAKLIELERRIKTLEEASGGSDTDVPSDEYPEYVPGKWYYGGDKCTFEGFRYVCTAPEGQVCTWSPVEYPAYWEIVL